MLVDINGVVFDTKQILCIESFITDNYDEIFFRITTTSNTTHKIRCEMLTHNHTSIPPEERQKINEIYRKRLEEINKNVIDLWNTDNTAILKFSVNEAVNTEQ